MLRLSQILLFLDPILATLFLLLVQHIYWGTIPTDGIQSFFRLGLIPATIVIFYLSGAYDEANVSKLRLSINRALLALGILVACFLLAAYLFKVSDNFPRLVIGPWVLSTISGIILLRVILNFIAYWRRLRGIGWEPVVLTGEISACHMLALKIAKNPQWGLHVVAIAADQTLSEVTDISIVFLPFEGFAAAVEEFSATRVILCGYLGDDTLIRGIFASLSHLPVTIQYAPDLSGLPILGMNVSQLDGQPLIDLTACPLDGKSQLIKWLEDKILSLVILIIISPFLILVAVAIKLNSPGPIFFVQKRHGMYGRPISVIKFRSMYINQKTINSETDNHLQKKLEIESTSDFTQAKNNDPRITSLGLILRRTSIDELPQFINVLIGDMSIVGPRPHPLKLNHEFMQRVDHLMRRHYVKPGITGLAQIGGARGETRDTVAMRRRIELDLDYLRNWSLLLDLKIIFLTIFQGFFNRQP